MDVDNLQIKIIIVQYLQMLKIEVIFIFKPMPPADGLICVI